MNEQDRSYRPEREIRNGTLDKVSSVVDVHRGGAIFVGWDSNGVPMATFDQSELSEGAKRSIQEYQKARLPIKRIPFSKVEPVNFRYVGQAVDYEDRGGKVAEDLLTYGIEDANGKSDTVSFGELAVLNAIVEARDTWQEMTNQVSGLPISTTNKIYTLFIGESDDQDRATAILFKPTIGDMSNETVFKLFLQQTLTNLLNIEKAQTQERFKKGYLNALENYIKDKPHASHLAGFIKLFVDVDEDQVAKFTEGLTKAAENLGILSSDNTEEPTALNPFTSDVDDLDTNTLFDLAENMRDAAYQVLR